MHDEEVRCRLNRQAISEVSVYLLDANPGVFLEIFVKASPSQFRAPPVHLATSFLASIKIHHFGRLGSSAVQELSDASRPDAVIIETSSYAGDSSRIALRAPTRAALKLLEPHASELSVVEVKIALDLLVNGDRAALELQRYLADGLVPAQMYGAKHYWQGEVAHWYWPRRQLLAVLVPADSGPIVSCSHRCRLEWTIVAEPDLAVAGLDSMEAIMRVNHLDFWASRLHLWRRRPSGSRQQDISHPSRYVPDVGPTVPTRMDVQAFAHVNDAPKWLERLHAPWLTPAASNGLWRRPLAA